MYVFFNLDVIGRDSFSNAYDIHFSVLESHIIAPYGNEWYKDVDALLDFQGEYVLPYGLLICNFLKKLQQQNYKLVLHSRISEDYLRLMWDRLQQHYEGLPDYVAFAIYKPNLTLPYDQANYVNHVESCYYSTGTVYQALEKRLNILPENRAQHIVIDLNSVDLNETVKLGYQAFRFHPAETSMLRQVVVFFINLLMLPIIFIASFLFNDWVEKFDAMLEKFIHINPHFEAHSLSC